MWAGRFRVRRAVGEHLVQDSEHLVARDGFGNTISIPTGWVSTTDTVCETPTGDAHGCGGAGNRAIVSDLQIEAAVERV